MMDQQALTEFLKGQGIDLNWMRTDHLSQASAVAMHKAAKAASDFLWNLETSPPRCLILSSSPSATNSLATGYGCGKTTLARLVHTCNCDVYQSDTGHFDLRRKGKMFTSAQLMAQLDDRESAVSGFVAGCGNLIVIDDIGREGSLRFEKREPHVQQAVIRNRYYDIACGCLEHKVNLLVTTNLTSVELINVTGGATWSRLNEMGLTAVNLTGVPDYRIESNRGGQDGS